MNAGTLEVSGGATLSLNGGLNNTGTLQAIGGGTLIVNGVTGDLGSASVSGSGSTLAVSGNNYIINQPVTATTGSITLAGTLTNISTIVSAGMLHLSNATVANAGGSITADGGTVQIANSTINGGTLIATDNAGSFVQFSGDVTLNGVTWQSSGAGVFHVYQTTARLMGDSAHWLPAGSTLVVDTGGASGQQAQLTLPGGVFTNEGIILLHGYASCPARLAFASDTTLAGSGQVQFGVDEKNPTYEGSGYRYEVLPLGAVAARWL